MSEQISSNFLIKWPNDSLTNDIYELFTSTDQYEIEKRLYLKAPHYIVCVSMLTLLVQKTMWSVILTRHLLLLHE